MAKKVRVEFPGATYRVMMRGNKRASKEVEVITPKPWIC